MHVMCFMLIKRTQPKTRDRLEGGGSAASTRVTGTVPRRDNAAPLNPRLGRVAPTRYRWERTGVTAECVTLGHGPAEWLSGSAKCKRSNT